jgi:hypothetical protein
MYVMMRTIQENAPATMQINQVPESFFFICSIAMRNMKAPNRNCEVVESYVDMLVNQERT